MLVCMDYIISILVSLKMSRIEMDIIKQQKTFNMLFTREGGGVLVSNT